MKKTELLFDSCLQRSQSHEHWRGTSRFDSLNQSAIPAMQTVRDELESWYARFPDQDDQLRSSFRTRVHNHDGAFFELFLHELLARLELSVEVQPTLEDGSSPDFFVSGSDGNAFVEATYLPQSGSLPPLEATVLNAIDDLDGRIPSDVGLSVWVTGSLNRATPLEPITRRICEWLNGLDPRRANWEKHRMIDVPVQRQYGDLILTLEAVPRLGENRVIASWDSGVRDASFGEQILKAVSAKARKYSHLDHPLVVAVNVVSTGAEEDEVAALFGDEAIRLRRSESGDAWMSAGIVRTGKALWFDNPKRCPHYPWLSAVMMFHDLAPWTVANATACLYLNPYVDDQVPRELQTLGYAAEAGGELKRYRGSRSVREVLELAKDWPGSFGIGG